MLNFNYSDFQCGAINGFSFSRGSGCRNEYRNGLLNTARARLAEQDLDKNGVLTKDEYLNVEDYVSAKRDAMNGRPPAGLSCYRDYVDKQSADYQRREAKFNALDVNRDGVLDQRELANEVNLMDTLGGGPNGRADGVVSQKGYDNLWRKHNLAQAGEMLKDNYSKMNMANLGMPWDNCCDYKSRAVGSRYQNEYGQPYYNYGRQGIPYGMDIPGYDGFCGGHGYVNPGYNYPQYANPQYQGLSAIYPKLHNIMYKLTQIIQMLMSRGYSY